MGRQQTMELQSIRQPLTSLLSSDSLRGLGFMGYYSLMLLISANRELDDGVRFLIYRVNLSPSTIQSRFFLGSETGLVLYLRQESRRK